MQIRAPAAALYRNRTNHKSQLTKQPSPETLPSCSLPSSSSSTDSHSNEGNLSHPFGFIPQHGVGGGRKTDSSCCSCLDPAITSRHWRDTRCASSRSFAGRGRRTFSSSSVVRRTALLTRAWLLLRPFAWVVGLESVALASSLYSGSVTIGPGVSG